MGEVLKLRKNVLRPLGRKTIDDCDQFPREVEHMSVEAQRLFAVDPRFLSTERSDEVSQRRTSLDISFALGVALNQMRYSGLYKQRKMHIPIAVSNPLQICHEDILFRPVGEGMVSVGIGATILRVNGYSHFSGLVIDGPCSGIVVRRHRSGSMLLDSVLNTFQMTRSVREELSEGQIQRRIEGYEYSAEEIVRADVYDLIQACCNGSEDAFAHEVMIEMASNVGIQLNPDLLMTMRIPQ